MPQSNRIHSALVFSIIGLLALVIFGTLWVFVIGERSEGTAGWYLFSYAMGLTMIVLPCTLPLAFVIVPLALKGGGAKGMGVAIAFGLGVALMLSLYGVAAAYIGQLALAAGEALTNTSGLENKLGAIKNWVYFIAGIFAYLFALGEIGLVKFHMPTYTGSAPAFIQKQQDYIKAFLLGMFLGNVGVGCPHPATPLILIEIISSANIFYGWSLFFVHAIGRVIPLLLLAFLGILGINALSWLVARKDKIERATGWAMVCVAGFILTLGLFTHDWWVNSGQHTLFEEITGEEFILGKVIDRFGFAGKPHTHGPEVGEGLFGLPLTLGNWVLVTLWLFPIWWYYIKKREEIEEATPPESTAQITKTS